MGVVAPCTSTEGGMSATPVPTRNPVFLGLFNAIAILTIAACIIQSAVRSWAIDGWFMPAIIAVVFILVTTDWDR